MENCIFCKIINKEIPSYTLYEDEDFIAFLDITQVTKGHTLVVTKHHYKNILDADENTSAQAYKIVNRLAKKLCKKLNASGVNIIQNNNEVAGQTVDHFHIHIIPRYSENDSIIIKFEESNIDASSVYDLLK
ncbi:HIT family protein [Mycoplasma sp. P36-A1]|uniref:HIT family protein n=1 Tax=Mycoplasma sp. P36-A1 TaxID=3252900 RepID=UPI003C30C7CC